MSIVPQDSPTLFDGQVCTKCAVWKPFSEYHVDRKKANGRHCYCKECSRLVRSQYYKENKVDLDAKAIRYQRDHRGGWYQRRLEKHRVLHSSQPKYSSDEERRAARRLKKRLWQQQNKPLVKAMQHRRRSARVNAPGSFSAQEWERLCAQYGNVCLCCKEAKPLHADHVVPLSRGGTNDIGNIQPLCKSCNSSKWARTIDYRLTFHNS